MSTATAAHHCIIEEAFGLLELSTDRVDRANKVINGVKIVGIESKNLAGSLQGINEEEFGDAVNRPYSYTMEALREAQSLYEGKKVYLGHTPFKIENGKLTVESGYKSRENEWIGVLKNVRIVEGRGLYGDLHYLETNGFTPTLIEAAERFPDQVGLSHEAMFSDPKLVNGKVYLDRITNVNRVALTGENLGTNAGLFETHTGKTPMKKTLKKILESVTKDTKGYGRLKHIVEMCDGEKPEHGYVAEMGEDEYSEMTDELSDMEMEVPEASSAEDQVKGGVSAAAHKVIDDILESGDQTRISQLLSDLGIGDSVSEMCAGGKAQEMDQQADDDEENMYEMQLQDELDVTPDKAKRILSAGKVKDKPLTDKQKGFLGAIAGRAVERAHQANTESYKSLVMECVGLLSANKVEASDVILEAMLALPTKDKRTKYAEQLAGRSLPASTTRSAAPSRDRQAAETIEIDVDKQEKGWLSKQCNDAAQIFG